MSGGARTDDVPAKREPKAWQHVIAGQVGGICGLVVSYPLDTIKIRLQTHTHYSGMRHCFVDMVKSEGALSMYRGLLSPVMGYGIINAVAFGTYGNVNAYMRGDRERLHLWETMLCGAAAGFTQSFVRAPIERIKTLCQAHPFHSLPKAGSLKAGVSMTSRPATVTPVYKGAIDCFLQVSRSEGFFRGVMGGTGATLAREMPQYMVYYPLYEGCKRLVTPKGQASDQIHPARLALAGGLAGALQWLPPIYSIDVVKSRIQAAPKGTYQGVWDCAVRTYRSEGAAVFVRGLSPALLRGFPLHGTIFVMYELSLRFLNAQT